MPSMNYAMSNQKVLSRFFSKVHPEPMSGCWLWLAGLDIGGYGKFHDKGRHQAHRWAYVRLKGPILEGLELDHLCRTRCCVNPDHLEPVTRSENNRRGLLPLLLREKAAKISCCPKGHPYSGENLYFHTITGGRGCRACRQEASRRYEVRRERPRKKSTKNEQASI